MAFPQIGLRAVLEISGFRKNYSQYQTMMRDMDRTTKQTAQKITQTTKAWGASVVKSFTDFAKHSSIVKDAYQNLSPQAAIIQIQDMEKAFRGLGTSAQVNVSIFDMLANAGVGFGDAMRVAAGQIQFSTTAFTDLMDRGVGVEEAFQRAASGAGTFGQSVTLLGRQFSIAAVQGAVLVAGLRALVGLVRESVESYSELAEATRRLHHQTGLLTQEASGWILAVQQTGVSTATSARAMTSFLGKVGDMRREMLSGEESTNDFALAIRTLGITITDSQGNLKSTEQLLGDVNRAFQNLGPGIVSAQLATDLFGYSGRFLLPILTDQERSLADLEQNAQDLGAALSSLDRKDYEAFRRANIDLQLAIQGVKNQVSRAWIPALTSVKEKVVDVIKVLQALDSALRAGQSVIEAVIGRTVKLADAWGYLIDQFRRGMGWETEVSRAQEEQAQATHAAAQAAILQAAAEQERQRALQKTLESLRELQQELSTRLLDIDRDATRHWEDIFVTRMRDAFDRALQLAWRLDDLRAELNKRLDDIEADFAERWDDILVKRQREAIERAMREAWKLEDMARAAEQRRLDVLRDYAEREAEQRRDVQKRIEDLEEDTRERREKLERDHQERLLDIELDYQDTVQEAARQNDAVAVARAMRERARELRDEQRRFSNEQRDLEDSLKKKREQIEEDRREREEDHKRELERALRRIEENHQRQLDQVDRQKARERQLRELHYRWELDDFNKARAKQQQAAQDWYDEQIDDLVKAQERENVLRAIQWQRQDEDFERNRARQLADAQQWYARERDELADHIDMTGDQLEQAYKDWQRDAAEAAATAAKAIVKAWASEIERYKHYLPKTKDKAKDRRIPPKGREPAPPRRKPPIRRSKLVGGVWVPMAKGGVIHASQPTGVVMGEAGPETGIFLPGGPRSLSVDHSFGRLGVDFGGLPGGMNTQQVEAIVFAVVTQLAKNVNIPGA